MKKLIITILLLTFVCVAEFYYVCAEDIFLIKRTNDSAILDLKKPVKQLKKTSIYSVIRVDEHGNTDKYKAYYYRNIVMFMYILVDKKDKVTLLFWSDDQDFVYRDDIEVKVEDNKIMFSESIDFEIDILE